MMPKFSQQQIPLWATMRTHVHLHRRERRVG
jgi:hypothetical protein